ncbi:MAG: Holliday junction branch migration protein RuvA [Prevotellaceae bacterium]|nr:Holliday junction branch migration protein RuvA [Prevotellaceae bacterium]
MFEYIRGELAELTPALAVVEASGVGYAINISLNTFTAIQGKKEVRLLIHEVLVCGGRDDSFTLFGFATHRERDLYRQLISVSGVGSNTARMILSSMSPAELVECISNGDEKLLKGVKGIGLKTAQRIIVDLRDKMAANAMTQGETGERATAAAAIIPSVKAEAVGALTMLGFAPAPSSKVVAEILKEQPDLHVEQVVKLALKQIK